MDSSAGLHSCHKCGAHVHVICRGQTMEKTIQVPGDELLCKGCYSLQAKAKAENGTPASRAKRRLSETSLRAANGSSVGTETSKRKLMVEESPRPEGEA